jgi:HD-like signal output (HDOD) protein
VTNVLEREPGPRAPLQPGPEILKTRALRSLSELPPFSPILAKLIASLAGGEVSFVQIGDLIEKDTVVAGSLLHIANSAMYARRSGINSVRHALSLLGLDKVRNAVLGMSITSMWSRVRIPDTFSMARFNTHSAAVAILSDLLAQRLLPVRYPEGAFVSGLLHDLGRLLIASALPGEHEAIFRMRHVTGRATLDCEREVLGFTHPDLSSDALAVWNLPAPIRVAVADHHAPMPEPGAIPLAALVSAANQYVNATGVSIIPGQHVEYADAECIAALGLEDTLLITFWRNIKQNTNRCPNSS